MYDFQMTVCFVLMMGVASNLGFTGAHLSLERNKIAEFFKKWEHGRNPTDGNLPSSGKDLIWQRNGQGNRDVRKSRSPVDLHKQANIVIEARATVVCNWNMGMLEGDGAAEVVNGTFGGVQSCFDAAETELASDATIVGARYDIALSQCSVLRGTTLLVIDTSGGPPVYACLFEEPCCEYVSVTGLTSEHGMSINGYYTGFETDGYGYRVFYNWWTAQLLQREGVYGGMWTIGPLVANCTSYCPTDCEAGTWHDRSGSNIADPNIIVECTEAPSDDPGGYVKYEGKCNTTNGTMYDLIIDAYHDYYKDYDYSHGGPLNITEHGCLSWCEWKKQTLNWTSFTACEWHAHGPSFCHIYGDNEATISGGDGESNVFCYSYEDAEETTGPISWHYPESAANGWLDAGTCDGMMQSPIDLDGSLKATIHAPIEYRNYFVNPNNNNRFYSGILQNNGHSIVWHLHSTETNRLAFCWKHGKCPSIRNGPFAGSKHTHAYYLLQLHFHWGNNGGHWNKGSEHTVDGNQYALEMHMVHIEDKYIDSEGTFDWDGALADPNGLAVLGILFNVDPKKPQNMQPLEVIDETLEDMANVPKHRRKREAEADEEAQMEEMARFHEAFEQLFAEDNARRVKRQILHHTEVKLRLNPGAFLRKATNRGYHANEYSTYWTYHGSLTTPTCNEVVTWVVFDRALHITQVQVNAFVHKFPNNFRTPNNLGSHNAGGRVDTMCGREIRLIHDQIEHHMGGFWG